MSKDIIKSLKSEEEVRIFAKVSGYDVGRTEKAIAEWADAQAVTSTIASVAVDSAADVEDDYIDDEDYESDTE